MRGKRLRLTGRRTSPEVSPAEVKVFPRARPPVHIEKEADVRDRGGASAVDRALCLHVDRLVRTQVIPDVAGRVHTHVVDPAPTLEADRDNELELEAVGIRRRIDRRPQVAALACSGFMLELMKKSCKIFFHLSVK